VPANRWTTALDKLAGPIQSRSRWCPPGIVTDLGVVSASFPRRPYAPLKSRTAAQEPHRRHQQKTRSPPSPAEITLGKGPEHTLRAPTRGLELAGDTLSEPAGLLSGRVALLPDHQRRLADVDAPRPLAPALCIAGSADRRVRARSPARSVAAPDVSGQAHTVEHVYFGPGRSCSFERTGGSPAPVRDPPSPSVAADRRRTGLQGDRRNAGPVPLIQGPTTLSSQAPRR
jgi:hypothetical protein